MDYEELIELSRKASEEWKGTHEYYQAATLITSLCSAIETLLAERDRALKDLRLYATCAVCKHRKDDFPCAKCRNEDCWKWRGLKADKECDADG